MNISPKQKAVIAWIQNWAWLPIPVLLALEVGLWCADLRGVCESPHLLMLLHLVFSVLASLLIASLLGGNFVNQGKPGMLLLGCGVVVWGMAGFMGVLAGISPADFSTFSPNTLITIYNTCVLLSGLCHLAGVCLLLYWNHPLPAPRIWLTVAYTAALGCVGVIVWATLSGWMPLFFVEGHGGTPVRQFVLIAAISLFILTACLLQTSRRKTPSLFAYLYSLSLLLLATGLFGLLLKTVLGDLLNWTARTAQFLGGAYMLVAAAEAVHRSGRRRISLGSGLGEVQQPYVVAVVIVIAAAAVRLVFLDGLGTGALYVIFYPAVMLAALYGGMRAGLLAAFLSVALTAYFWIIPNGRFSAASHADGLAMIIFLLGCTMISWITEVMHRVRARAITAEQESKRAAELVAVRKRVEEERTMTVEFLHLVNNCKNTHELIQRTTAFFQKCSECDAVGMRLRDGEDFPYYETSGFSREFVKRERNLCVWDASGCVQRDAQGNARLAGLCGKLLSAENAPAPENSFWTNDMQEFAHSLSASERQSMRGRCFDEGYQSIALIPFAQEGKPIGLLQLNSFEKNRFTHELIALWERMAAQLAIALGKFRAEEEILKAYEQMEQTVTKRTAELRAANAGLQEKEMHLRKANRDLLILTACDEALLRATTETELLNQICNLVVKIDNVLMAWVGFAEQNEEKTVRPVTQSGGDKEYLKKIRVSWADTPRGNGPTGRSIRTHEVIQLRNIATDPYFEPWREDAIQRGYASMIALPLLWKDQCLGALSIYSSQVGGFSEDETELLTRLVGDLTFGVIALRARAAHEQLQRDLLTVSEREKQIISQELHDGLCQNLAGTAMMASVLHRHLAAKEDPDAEYAKQISVMLGSNVNETRNLSHGLHPVGPEGEGLMNALSQLVETVSNLFHIRCFFRCPEPVLLENEVASTHFFRIAQEAINNARKHGEASRILIDLQNTPEGISLTIRDNGVGIPLKLPKKYGLGLRGMHYRAAEIGATLTVCRVGKRGTLVTCIYRPSELGLGEVGEGNETTTRPLIPESVDASP